MISIIIGTGCVSSQVPNIMSDKRENQPYTKLNVFIIVWTSTNQKKTSIRRNKKAKPVSDLLD
jgi:hypothetical protein